LREVEYFLHSRLFSTVYSQYQYKFESYWCTQKHVVQNVISDRETEKYPANYSIHG
jgi:hypothetical protein